MTHSRPSASRKLPVIAAMAVMTATFTTGCSDRDGPAAEPEIIPVPSPAAPGSMSPHLALTPDGHAVMSWLEPVGNDAYAVKYSLLQDDAWSSPVSIAEDRGWFVNWADFPSVVPVTARQWAAHWLVKRPGGTYSYDIAISISADGGAGWSAPLTPHTDDTPTEHGFVSLFPWSGDIGAVWLDGRNMQPDTGNEPASGDREYGGMTLRYARIDYDGKVLDDGEIDDLVCDCCQTDIALAAAGPVVAYRDRTAGETRDIQVRRYAGGGWSDPVTVSDDPWHIPGCPVNGPALAADGKSLVVAWYGAPNRRSRVKIAWSRDAGKTFSAPVIVDENDVKGRVDVALLADGAALVSWVGKSPEGQGQLRMRRITADGQAGPIRLIAAGRYSRNAGFPQIIRAGDRIVYAWPEPGDPRQVLTAFSPLADG